MAMGMRVSAIIISCLFLGALPAGAVTGPLNLTTSPLPILLTAQPGETVTTELRVKNSSTQTERLRIDLYKFTARGEQGDPYLLDPEPGDRSVEWVSFSKSEFEAPPGEWQTIQMSIAIPADAAFGYYYAVAFTRADAPKPEPGNTAITGGTAVLVLLEATSPNAKRQAELVEFKADRRFYEFLPVNLSVRMRNSGNVHLAPFGNIFLSGPGSPGRLEVNSSRGNILPQSNREFSVKWADGFPVYTPKTEAEKVVMDENGRPKQVLEWNFNEVPKLRIGRYTAKLVMVYDNGQRDVPLEGVVSFWVVPWRLLGGALLVAALALIGLRSTFKNLWQKIKRPGK
jgi:hypothetical protein